MSEYKHTEDMGEISGFGGSYEAACQDMLSAGVNWLEKHKTADLQAKTLTGVYGVLTPTSDDAEALSNAIVDVCESCASAMHQAVMSRLFYIAKNGWDAYCVALRNRNAA